MTATIIDQNKTKFYVPDRIVCKIKPDPELVLLCQTRGGAIYRGVPIGKMSDIWPFIDLKRDILGMAKTFVEHMRLRGKHLRGDVTQIEVWGPYRDKPLGVEEVNIEAGNPLVPEGRYAMRSRGAWQPETTGPQSVTRSLLDRGDFRHGICYRLRGEFLLTKGFQEESTGTVIV